MNTPRLTRPPRYAGETDRSRQTEEGFFKSIWSEQAFLLQWKCLLILSRLVGGWGGGSFTLLTTLRCCVLDMREQQGA